MEYDENVAGMLAGASVSGTPRDKEEIERRVRSEAEAAYNRWDATIGAPAAAFCAAVRPLVERIVGLEVAGLDVLRGRTMAENTIVELRAKLAALAELTEARAELRTMAREREDDWRTIGALRAQIAALTPAQDPARAAELALVRAERDAAVARCDQLETTVKGERAQTEIANRIIEAQRTQIVALESTVEAQRGKLSEADATVRHLARLVGQVP